MIQLILVLTAGAIGFILARNFVRRRLRFVDAVHSPFAPFIAGGTAAVIASPIALLPLFSLGCALAFGIGTGLGTASGARVLRSRDPLRRQLPP
jgi:hypothetical protein